MLSLLVDDGLASSLNGNVTVSVGLTSAGGRSLPGDQRAERARRLRRDGWSFRRIATTLGIGYNEVARLLEPEAREHRWPTAPRPPALPRIAPPVAAPPAAPLPPASAPLSPTLETLIAEFNILKGKLDLVQALCEGQRQALGRLETSLTATLRSEHQQLGQKMLTGMRTLLERMLPAKFHTMPKGGGDGRG